MKDLKRFLFSGLFLLTLACSTDEPAPAAAVPVAVSSISINNGTEIGISALSLNMGKTATLTAVVLPEDAADKTVTWSSADATIASIDAAGVITPVKEGTVIITATSAQTPAVSAQISLTVLGKYVAIVPATSISIKNGGAVITTLSLGVGGTATLTAVVLPENATNKSVTWRSADATIATINATGVITPLKAGTVVIKATSTSTTTVSASVTLTVTETNIAPTSISINNGAETNITTLNRVVGATATLTAVVLPENATNKSVSWSSSTAATATITTAGVVTAVAVGTTTITATSVSAATVVGTVTLTVVPPPPPTTPTILIAQWASAAATADLTLSWDTVTGATSYKVYKDAVLVATVTTNTSTITGVSATGVYTVSAANTAGESAKAGVFSTMMLVPAGNFTMGQGDILEANPARSVTLTKAYYMNKTEVTFAQYDAFCDATSRTKPSDNGFGRGTRPVIKVTWDDAVAYTTWISGKIGKTYRLPTEAEWEYACRAGTTTIYNTGDGLTKDQANVGGTQTVAVGSYLANAWGLQDMHGNVWEWCSDWYETYEGAEQTDPKGPTSGDDRVVRGGSWYNTAEYCSSAYRYYDTPSVSYYSMGFRVVVTQ